MKQRLPATNTKTPMPDVKPPRVDIGSPMNPPDTVPYAVIVERDMTIHLLKNENHRLRAALVSSELNASIIVGDSPCDAFKIGINTLRDAVKGIGHDIDMAYIARYNHDKIDIDDLG